MAGPPQQRRGSPNTTLQTRSSEAPWMRDHRRTPRSARSPRSNNPFESPAAATRQPAIDERHRANQRNPFAQQQAATRSGKRMNPFDSPDAAAQQRQRNTNPFDSPAAATPSRTTVTTTVTTVGNARTNPFATPSLDNGDTNNVNRAEVQAMYTNSSQKIID